MLKETMREIDPALSYAQWYVVLIPKVAKAPRLAIAPEVLYRADRIIRWMLRKLLLEIEIKQGFS